MHRHSPPLFAYLRCQRGVWVLALAVLMFKVAMSTFCVLDGPRVAFAGDNTKANVAATASLEADDDLCVLDEGKGCHCTCAHATALPASPTVMPVAVPMSTAHALLRAAASPAFVRSPLRPPIA